MKIAEAYGNYQFWECMEDSEIGMTIRRRDEWDIEWLRDTMGSVDLGGGIARAEES